jgi:hypothetical protein
VRISEEVGGKDLRFYLRGIEEVRRVRITLLTSHYWKFHVGLMQN